MKQEAKILVECGYADSHIGNNITICVTPYLGAEEVYHPQAKVDPYADTLEGRRQCCALWHELDSNNPNLWAQSYSKAQPAKTNWAFVVSRVQWCCKQLEDR